MLAPKKPPHPKHKRVNPKKFDSTAIQLGGTFTGSDRSQPMVVDHSCHNPLLKKVAGSQTAGLKTFDMFKPATPDPTQLGHKQAGKNMHTDPFAEDRAKFIPKEKKLLAPKKAVVHQASKRRVSPTIKDGAAKEKTITANGQVHSGGKYFGGHHNSVTTYDRELGPQTDYSSMTRFRNSAKTGPSVSPISPTDNHAPKSFVDAVTGGTQHVGKHRIGGAGDTSHSLEGVLRIGAKETSRAYNYRPPWGTCNTPRVTAASTEGPKNHGRIKSSAGYGGPTPWATSATAVRPTTAPLAIQ